MANKIKITATTAEEFSKIEEKLSYLSDTVKAQIDTVRKNILTNGIFCLFSEKYEANPEYWIPSNTNNITNDGDRVLIYAGDYVFEIGEKNAKKPLSFKIEKAKI